jgi:hypothetical protein
MVMLQRRTLLTADDAATQMTVGETSPRRRFHCARRAIHRKL